MTEAKVKKTTKPAVRKTTVKASVKTAKAVKKAEVKVEKPIVEKAVSLKVSVFDVSGKSAGSMTLPASIFGAKPNKALVAQAVRVYLANQRQGNASTQTRGEITGSTKKIYRQKGTGRARHGALKAPIFVGGGVAHGPRPHSFTMDLPKKMRKAALITALSAKATEGKVKVIEGDFSGKTKEVAKLLQAMDLTIKGKVNKVLFVTDGNESATRGAHNISGVEILTSKTLSTYPVASNRNIVFLKNSVDELEKRLISK